MCLLRVKDITLVIHRTTTGNIIIIDHFPLLSLFPYLFVDEVTFVLDAFLFFIPMSSLSRISRQHPYNMGNEGRFCI